MNEWITVDSNICGGKPVIRGTRIMVKNILGLVAGGYTVNRIIDAYPELAREIVRRGHLLGNHTMTHPQHRFWRLGSRATRREILDCSRAIREVTGIEPVWFRAPVGHRNYFTHPVTEEAGMQVMAWNRRGYDAVSRDVDGVVRRITKHLRPGDIVLVHEATPIAEEVLARVLDEASRRGLRLADDSL